MRCTVFIAALLAAAPAVGVAAGQSAAATERAHPSASAHATAVAAQADAARIEACANTSSALLAAFNKDDFKTASANFNAQMRGLVDAQKMGEVRKSITAQFGEFQSRGTSQSVMYEGNPVVNTPMHYAKGNLAAVVACDKDGKVAGMRLQPPTSP